MIIGFLFVFVSFLHKDVLQQRWGVIVPDSC